MRSTEPSPRSVRATYAAAMPLVTTLLPLLAPRATEELDAASPATGEVVLSVVSLAAPLVLLAVLGALALHLVRRRRDAERARP